MPDIRTPVIRTLYVVPDDVLIAGIHCISILMRIMYFTKKVSDDFLELITTKFNPMLKSSYKWKCLECPLKSQVPDI